MMKLIQPIALGLFFATSLGATTLAAPRSSTAQVQSSPQTAPLELQGQRQTPPRTGFGGPGGLRDQCPQGQQPSSWQKPIYDEAGLFVVGWETVATCVPEGLEPAG